MRRREALAIGEIYHVCNKTIAGYKIFNYAQDYFRMKQMLLYYRLASTPGQFSNFLKLCKIKKDGFFEHLEALREDNADVVQIIAYCVMPTHIHLAMKQLQEGGITKFMRNLLNSYSRYFNIKTKRNGPLWVGRFKSVRVKSDEQLLHLTRYIHLNPVTASLVRNPEDWEASSYGEYISTDRNELRVCDFENILDILPERYASFVKDGTGYQKDRARIKHLMLDEDP